MPDTGGAFSLLAQREGDRSRTGIILATQGAEVMRLSAEADTIITPVLLDLEPQLSAMDPLADRAVDRQIFVDLTGEMMSYFWGSTMRRLGPTRLWRLSWGHVSKSCRATEL